MKQPPEVIRQWIDDSINDAVKPLSAWEESFLASIEEQFLERGTLTDAQIDKLEQIYARVTA